MANDVVNFIPEVWSLKTQDNLDNSAVFSGLVNRDYEGEVKSAGDTVKIRAYGDITNSAYTRNMTISFQDLDDPMDTMTIAQQRYFAFKLDDLDKRQADLDILGGYEDRGMVSIRLTKDQHIHAIGYAAVESDNPGSVIGSSAAPITITKDNVYDYTVQLGELMDSANCPSDGRWLVIPPSFKSALLRSPEFTRATDLGDKVVEKGYLGEINGFMVKHSTNLNSSGGNTPVLAGTMAFITYVDQLSEVEKVRPYDMFADAVKGLYLYQAHVPTNHAGYGGVLWVAGT